jgi:predicted chitinase
MSAFEKEVTKTLFFGSLPAWQREPVMRIVEEGQRRNRMPEEIAYVLATGYHETARWKYDEEIGKGRGRDYGEPIWLIRGQRVTYHGRGDTQLTWLHNYAKMSVFLTLEHGRPINLVSKPELATEPEYSSLIIWEGMIRGMFTGKNLADYIRPGSIDYRNARRIVNGTDKANRIAGYAKKFEEALRKGD